MNATTVTVLVGGWWLPGRHLTAGDTLTLDAATAEALARRGIVRLPDAVTGASQPDEVVASNANKPARKRAKKED